MYSQIYKQEPQAGMHVCTVIFIGGTNTGRNHTGSYHTGCIHSSLKERKEIEHDRLLNI